MRESDLNGEKDQARSDDAQVFDDPLHDAKVVHHLNEGNEEDDSTQDTGEEPAFVYNGILIEEEDSTDVGLLQEVGCEESEPLENLEASIGLEDEEGDGLLEEETNNNRLPTGPS